MAGRGKSKAKVHMSKPEPPPFLQRIREQLVEKESSERKEQSEKKRKERSHRKDSDEDDPTIVKLDDEDLTEEEYKRIKKGEPDLNEALKSPDMSNLISKSDKTVSKQAKDNKKLSYGSSSDEDEE